MNKKEILKIPNNWVWVKLGDICLQPQYGWTTSAAKKGTLRLLRTTDITSGSIDWDSVPFCEKEPAKKGKYLLKDGDIVISRAGSVGYSILVKDPKKAVFASYLIRFRPLTNVNYVAYFLQSPLYWKSISEKRLGIAVPNVNASKLKQIGFPLPPLPEQQKIVEKIEGLFTKLDAGVEVLKKIKNQIKQYRQAVLKYAFEGKLTEEWRKENKDKLEPASVLLEKIKKEKKKQQGKKYKELPPVDTSKLPELPEGWVWSKLGELVTFEYGKGLRKDKRQLNGNVPVYGSNGLVGYHSVSLTEKSCLVVGRKGSSGSIHLSRVPCWPIDTTYFIEPPKEVNLFFLYYLLSTLNLGSLDKSTAIPGLNRNDAYVLPIPFPPHLEQHKIVEEIEKQFSVADEIEKVVDQSLKQAERLRQSILKKAFEGKLTEKWREEQLKDPNSPLNKEPADKLLERIKAEKAKLQKEKKANRKKGKQSKKPAFRQTRRR